MHFWPRLSELQRKLMGRLPESGTSQSIEARDVHFMCFAHDENTPPEFVGFHKPSDQIFVPASLHPAGDEIAICAPVAVRREHDHATIFVGAAWLKQHLKKEFPQSEHAWRIETIEQLEKQLRDALAGQAATPLQPSFTDVNFFGFATPDGRPMGHVGHHESGRIFVSSRLHPEGMSEAVQASAKDYEPVVWRDHPDDLIAYVDSRWLARTIAQNFPSSEHAWRIEAIHRMEAALQQARSGLVKGSVGPT